MKIGVLLSRVGGILLLWLCGLSLAQAVPSVPAPNVEFIPADSARDLDSIPNNGDEYMDSGGTWNGAAEVSNTSGDTFRITITNNAAGVNPLIDDIAFDIALSLSVPTGMRLPTSPFTVATSASGGDPIAANCIAPGSGSITATQAGGAGTPVTFVIPADSNLPAQGTGTPCNYTFTFGLTTNTVAPFASTGNNQLDYTFTYNEIDDDAGSQQTVNRQQTVAVRAGDIIVTKATIANPSDPNGAYADGETAQWTVSVFNNGGGGTFAAQITDTPNANFNLASLQLTPPVSPPGTPFPVPPGNNQYTISYLTPGQTVDVNVAAQVSVPSGATSCPDLRNDVVAQDRLNNSSNAFDSAVFNLQDPLLDYNPPNFAINFGTPTTVSFTVSNPGLGADGGTAKNIFLNVTGLNGVSISNVSAEWVFDAGNSRFEYVGPDTIPASGDEIIVNGGSSLLQFDASVSSCNGPTGGLINWTPDYENICGLNFTPPLQTSTYSVNNFPTLSLTKAVTPTVSNFGQPASYSISLNGTNIAALPPVAGTDNDWTVTDTFPVTGFGNGIIPTVPTGTIIEVGFATYNDTDTNIPVNAGDTLTWRGDQSDLTPVLPSITINFDLACPIIPPTPPVTVSNTAQLNYPSCGINVTDTANIVVNESPISSAAQTFAISAAVNPPFETGRPDTDLVANNEPNEGERITFTATYAFPNGYPGQWSGSRFQAEMGTGFGGLTGAPLQLAFVDGNANDVPNTGEISGVNVEVINPNGADYGPVDLPVGLAAGNVQINPGGDIEIANLDFIAAVVGSASMAEMTLIVNYTVTAPEGALDGNLQPLNDDNVGAFDERVTLSVANNPTSCSGGTDFTQGLSAQLERSSVMVFGSIDTTNDAGACGTTTANVDVIGPVAGNLRADNVRVFLQSTDYDLPTVVGDVTIAGAGNLNTLTPQITFPAPADEIDIHVTPNDSDNLTDTSRISFPIALNGAATGRMMLATVYFDSHHTSPDFSAAIDGDEDYSFGPIPIIGPPQSASLDVEYFPPGVILGDPMNFADVDGIPGQEGVFTWLVRLTNTGTTTLSNYTFTNEVPPGFLPYRAGSTPVADAGLITDPLMVWTGLPDIPPAGSQEIIVAIGLIQNAGCNVSNPNQTRIFASCINGTELFSDNGPGITFPNIDLQLQHRASSFCELCRDGDVYLEVRNEGASDLYGINITENLAGSGLEYVLGTAEVFVEGGIGFVPIADHLTTTATQIVWDSTVIPDLGQLFSDLNNIPSEMTIRFRVRSSDPNPENLLAATRQITASADFNLFCGDPGLPAVVDNFTVPLRQPVPQLTKYGRNVSAGQTASDYGAIPPTLAAGDVPGGARDIVIWRLDVANIGDSDLEDLELSDIIDNLGNANNFDFDFICPTDADAAASMALGAVVGNCQAIAGLSTVLDVDDPFGNPDNDEPGAFVDVLQNDNGFVYIAGRIQSFCVNNNNAGSIEWGCEVTGSPGGINASTTGVPALASDSDTALLSTAVNPSGVIVSQTVTGIDLLPGLGVRGFVNVTVQNQSGGTIRNIQLTDLLPTDYEIDTTFDVNSTLVVTPAFNTYPGIIDQVLVNSTVVTQPVFTFNFSVNADFPEQENVLRHGDELTFSFRVIRTDPAHFDRFNNPEVRTETSGTATDPNYTPNPDNNTLRVQFENTCSTVFNLADDILSVDIDPEDLDIDINPADPNLIFILSDPAATLNLDINLNNNGGHAAEDYAVYVTVGEGINILSLPPVCTLSEPAPTQIGEPPNQVNGVLPPIINDASSLTYQCERTTSADGDPTNDILAAGATDIFNFVIERDVADTTGDLTFRADVLGRIMRSDGTALPDAADPFNQARYSKDNILARIIGFNLFKRLPANCTEDNPPSLSNNNVIIGEECGYQVRANWFGFATPGFGNVEIRNARIYEGGTTNNPPAVVTNPPDALDGQGIVTVPTTSLVDSMGVPVGGVSITANPAAPAPLQETGFLWTLGNIDTAAIATPQVTFTADATYRVLNDPIVNLPVPPATPTPPNYHGNVRTDEVNAQFEVFFPSGPSGPLTILFDETTAGYPTAVDRTVDVTITEPNVTIIKEVCNESISITGNPANSGINCTPFVALPTLQMGDADDFFIFRLSIPNESTANGVTRAPAYDLIITDQMDASDLIAPLAFDSDGLDNDADGLIDAADLNGEGVVDDITLNNSDSADITFDTGNSTALNQINPGTNVQLFYRARLDATVTPTQQLINTASGSYDSLPGASGSQTANPGAINTLTGSRQYNIPAVQSTIEIDNITLPPGSKEIINTSRRNSGLVAGACPAPCTAENIVIGEEVLVELEFTVPVSELRQFTLEDNLPAGIECVEAMGINLPQFPGSDPGFTPGTAPGNPVAASVCDANRVRWDLGLHRLEGSGGTTQFTIQAQFIARVMNTAVNNNNDIIANGGASTSVFVSYRDDSNTQQNIQIGEARLTVQEPQLTITKTMDPVPPNTSVDASDIFNVTVQIDNVGTADAFNIELLDTLDTSISLIAGSIAGANPPDVIDLSVPATPRFSYNNPLAASGALVFTYQVQAANNVQPLEQLSNTIDVRYTSLPNNTIALNAGGNIGLDGAGDGMRIGAVPPAGDAINDYEFQVTEAAIVPPWQITKTDLNPALVTTIGARKQFQLTLDFPEGVSNGVVVNDNLASGTTGFVLEHDATFDIQYQCSGISTIRGAAIDCTDTATATTTITAALTTPNEPADAAAGTISWNFDAIVTAVENDASVNNISPQLTISYYARVANDAGTVAGATLQNAAEVVFRNGENNANTTVAAPLIGPYTVVEPDLEVTKNFINLPPPVPVGNVVQGVPAEFEILVVNMGGAASWDTVIEDVLPNRSDPVPPGGLTFPGGFCDTAPLITQIDVAGRVLAAGADYSTSFVPPVDSADPSCEFTITLSPTNSGMPANAARIDVGETLTIRYTVLLDVGTASAIGLTNVAGATQWHSLDTDGVSVPPEIRTYNRALNLPPDPNPGTVGIPDHQDAVTVQTLSPDLAVNKTVENITAGQNPAVTASPGDTLRYTILVSNTGPIDANNVQITDEPDALNLLNFSDGYFENSPAGTLRNVLVNGLPVNPADNFSNASGGSNGAGLLDVRNQIVPSGGALAVAFEIDVEDLNVALPRALIENQASVDLPGFNTFQSNVTQTELINTAPEFIIEKTSQDISGDPNVLVSGDTLRYRISIKNIGASDPTVGISHAVNTIFQDQIPANTTYIANSTQLNGAAVADTATNVAPFVNGLSVNSPDVAVAGFMTTNPDTNDASNVAIITFDVAINTGLINGTVISNQGFITGQQQTIAPLTPRPFTPAVTDDPGTPNIPDDPTQDVIGNGVNLDVLKTVTVLTGGDAIANTGETLRYRMEIVNRGNIDANNVSLTDALPNGTSFVSGSLTLNSIVVPDSGTLPLITGIALSSSDLTPPLPAIGAGTLTAGAEAVVEFDVVITAANGTVISNQALLSSNEQPDELSDVDGNDENGDQATLIVVGGRPDLEITKEVVIVGGGTVQAGGQLEYLIRVENVSELSAANIVITDSIPALTGFVTGSARLNGQTDGVSFAGGVVTADYSNTYGTLAVGDSFLLSFRVVVDASASSGESITNSASVVWNNGAPPNFNNSDAASVDVGGAPGVANINGRVWFDANHNNMLDGPDELAQTNWTVRLYINNNNPDTVTAPIAETVTDDQGNYNFNGLAPVASGLSGAYTLAFSVPADGAAYPGGSNVALGRAASGFGTAELMRIVAMQIDAGRNAQNENLPINPTGVVYNAVTRAPVQGARVRLLDANNNPLPATCFTTPAHLDSQQGLITSIQGFYRFDLNFSEPACPASATNYSISVETLSNDGLYLRDVSLVIPPEVGSLNLAACPDGANDRVPSPPPDTCEVQEQALQPDAVILPGSGTRYFLDVNIQAGPERLFNNHIPVDMDVGELVTITKETPLTNVVRGQLVPYVITIINQQNFPISAVEIRDRFPAGFKYVEGSAVLNGAASEPLMDAATFSDPAVQAGTLTWAGVVIPANSQTQLKLLLIVGSGVGEAEYVNRAQVFITGLATPISGVASATVRVVPDPTFDCSDIIGKVFDDKNINGYHDNGESGVAGVRIATAQGLLTTTDKHGRFHIACAAVPNQDRGSNFILKLDERSLPTGYRVTTENPRVQRLTRGKLAKFNFGVTLHRLVRMDLVDKAFIPGSTEIQEHWRYVVDDLLKELQEGPSVLRIAYLADIETEGVVDSRIRAIKTLIEKRWAAMSCCYNLNIETEVFWRRGQPLQ